MIGTMAGWMEGRSGDSGSWLCQLLIDQHRASCLVAPNFFWLASTIHPFSVALTFLGSQVRWNLFQEAGSPLDWSSINYSARVDKNPFTHSTFTPTDDLRVLGEPNMNVFGMWVESGVPEENPRRHGKRQKKSGMHVLILVKTWGGLLRYLLKTNVSRSSMSDSSCCISPSSRILRFFNIGVSMTNGRRW